MEEEKQENNKIMKEPKMTEKELVNIVNGQKNGERAMVQEEGHYEKQTENGTGEKEQIHIQHAMQE